MKRNKMPKIKKMINNEMWKYLSFNNLKEFQLYIDNIKDESELELNELEHLALLKIKYNCEK